MSDIDAEIDRLIKQAQPPSKDDRWTTQLYRVSHHISRLINAKVSDISVDQVLRYVRGVPDRQLRGINGIGAKGIAKLRVLAPYDPPKGHESRGPQKGPHGPGYEMN